jgi:hypothetical protein
LRNPPLDVDEDQRPLWPVFSSIETMRSTRRVSTPMFNGPLKIIRAAANIRRGAATGGMKPPRAGWPSAPISDCRRVSAKQAQCQAGGTTVGGRG